MNIMAILFGLLVFVSVSGLFSFVFFERLNGRRRAEFMARALGKDQAQGLAVLPALRTNDNTITRHNLEYKLRTAGVSISPEQFQILLWTVPVITFAGTLMAGGGFVFGSVAGAAAFLGMPRLAIKFLIRRRLAQFKALLPGTIDVIVRGSKAGLPLAECVRNIAAEGAEPMSSEFRQIIQDQVVGRSLPEAFANLANRINTQEAHLLSLVITVQQQTGGNIAEILQNFSETVRARAAMKGRIESITAESKWSAYILSLLPIASYKLLAHSFPDQMRLLWDTREGNLALAGIATWSIIGIIVIFKIIDVKV